MTSPRPGATAPAASGPPRKPARHKPVRRALGLIAPAAVLLAVALAGPWLAPHAIDKPVTGSYATAGDGAVLGGDQLGRDVLSRLLDGGTALIGGAFLVGVTVTGLAAVLGCLAVLRPRLGTVLERAADLAILLPPVLGIMLIALAWPDGGRWAVILAAITLGTPYAVRVVAAAAAPLASAGYVEAALMRGESTFSVITRELLPNLRATVLTLFGLRFVEAAYIISTAAFLQIGPQPPEADWALMIRENAPGILLNPWAVLAPSAAIALLAITVNLAATALAPRTKAVIPA
ncbi:ABC transporter permease subunit [Yinghuangia sp. ASG 101]|uniref:ABC transporter permease n=1 Tax=Yinghuangia sp. ASG 101 TaxID=2896848 RepID=UPI001E30B7F3|nr:ABC transporter permease subunit [Yinghuangia sp. ASG 101]UGQ13466.1 ABC transporter permease subunit [Yinghuangia sp. ASG 101]